jgi:hypothetical protein
MQQIAVDVVNPLLDLIGQAVFDGSDYVGDLAGCGVSAAGAMVSAGMKISSKQFLEKRLLPRCLQDFSYGFRTVLAA